MSVPPNCGSAVGLAPEKSGMHASLARALSAKGVATEGDQEVPGQTEDRAGSLSHTLQSPVVLPRVGIRETYKRAVNQRQRVNIPRAVLFRRWLLRFARHALRIRHSSYAQWLNSDRARWPGGTLVQHRPTSISVGRSTFFA